MTIKNGERLVRELLADPQKFSDGGRAYQLLEAFFAGLPIETLRPLLASNNQLVQRAGAFVASELGSQGRDLVDDVIPLLQSPDRHVQHYAMEVLAVCCEGHHAGKFAHVVRMLESGDRGIRLEAMELMSKADPSQIEAAEHLFKAADQNDQVHRNGLRTLIGSEGGADVASAKEMIDSDDPLVRRYGAIAAKRLARLRPELMRLLSVADDPDLRDFSK